MKKNIARIYDKNKINSRKKYMLIILLILVLQVAIYFGAFSKAETVIPIEYINYYSLETFESSIEVKTDLKGKYITFPEIINNREVITYYVEEVIETAVVDNNTVDNTIEETVVETAQTKEYKPNDTYYLKSEESLTIKVEYGEYITIAQEDSTEDTTNTEDTNTISPDDEAVEDVAIRDTVYLGNIRTRRRRRN